MAELPVEYDPNYQPLRITVNPRDEGLALPVSVGNTSDLINSSAPIAPSAIDRLFGTNGQERFQTWPERMVRSGLALPADVYEGRTPIESPTGYPGSLQPSYVTRDIEPTKIPFTNYEIPSVLNALGVKSLNVPNENSEIARAQDTAGMAGLGGIGMAPKGVLGTSGSNAFYSNLERTIANAKVEKATPEQWQSYLKNQPGIKSEELEFAGLNNLPNKVLSKTELESHVAENGVKLGEVWKGDNEWWQPTYKDTLTRNLSYDYKNILNEFNSAADVEIAKKHNTGFRETVKGYSNDEIFKAIQEAKTLPEFHDKLFQKYDTQAEAQAAIKEHGAENHVDLNQKREKVDTKYSSYQLPGGENYKELLLTVPNEWEKFRATQIANDGRIKDLRQQMHGTSGTNEIRAEISKLQNENQNLQTQIREAPIYKSSHWDEPNVLAHIRMNDRDIPGVGKTLHVEEIQSDFMQAHRKEVIKIKEAVNKDFDTIADKMVKAGVIKKICD